MSLTGDRSITCRDCGQTFLFTVREQQFFAERGFGDPVRCVPCRRAHKARRSGEGPVPTVPPRTYPPREASPGGDPPPPRRPAERDPAPGGGPPAPLEWTDAPATRRQREQRFERDDPEYSYAAGDEPPEEGRKKRKRFRYAEADPDDF